VFFEGAEGVVIDAFSDPLANDDVELAIVGFEVDTDDEELIELVTDAGALLFDPDD